MNNIEYQIAHTLRELRDWTSKGYRFLAVLDPNDWLMIKEEESLKIEGVEPKEADFELTPKDIQKAFKSVKKEEPPLYVSKKKKK